MTAWGGRALKTVGFWLKNARCTSFAQSFMPTALAAFFVFDSPDFNVNLALLAVVGVVLAHFGANLLDDYFDYRCEAVQKRREMLDGGMRARSMKCRYLEDGSTTVGRLLAAGLAFCGAALACGATIWLERGAGTLIFAGIGAFLAFFYSAPPFRLSFRGLGELTVGALFGPTAMCGVAFSACGRFDWGVFVVSIPMGLLVANILYVHSIMDLEPDLRAGKRTLAALAGTPRRAVALCGALLTAIYLAVAVGVAVGALAPTTLTVFLSAPLAVALYRSMREYLRDPEKRPERKFWHGPMEAWDLRVKAGIDWFMFRWYMARNLTIAFTLCVFVSVIVERLI